MGEKKPSQASVQEPEQIGVLKSVPVIGVCLEYLFSFANYNNSKSLIRKLSDKVFSFFWCMLSGSSDKKLEMIKTKLFSDVKGNVLEIGPGTGATIRYLKFEHIEKLVMVEPTSYFHGKLEEEGKKLGYQVTYINKNLPNFVSPTSAETQDETGGETGDETGDETNSESRRKSNKKQDSEKVLVKRMLILNGTLDNADSGEIAPSVEKNGPYDSAISCLVLCSVDEVRSTIDSIAKLLKPGGKFYFIEHVSAKTPTTIIESLIYYAQRIFNPFWKFFAGNCHLSRKTDQIIKSSKLFKNVKITHVGLNRKSSLPDLLPLVYCIAEKA